ncbi:coA-transferase III family protein [Mycobacterium kansasii 732]|uniref:Acetyl-CoA:oxalate CoA-transferase n=1 Tax=Mycobacterium pseudokansasii TaxID=2341080 RepID=A0A498QNH3_9MYCO|nr:CoA transferase [Mycobacterium pseudokansasii]EUA14965.1 coA-transferase III family protein [Mycobacterium kansasii 732]KZS67341.1 acyl-CoA transferase [Mycobacterium kansasii]MBY0389426.1 CoA transferase [Mycobacterium pseudokansasii]VAZ90928.1 Acetyl-CoA:oxalate CoA-transferase [Mycobacterium pseudokansasii]VAZ91810.1 Acetyl-CoA:oxalate CoA-transferase [Mycobacterium pseudokansasii]
MQNDRPAKPLDGFRVLDFTQNVAGPLAGQVLADLGAEVIKIEAPGGEAARHITAVLPGRPPLPTYFLPNNRGKKSVTADLTTGAARQQILRLADTADVVLEGFRPGVMERMGLGPEDLRARNPKLIYARLSAFGGNGPHGNRPGVDLMVAAEAGMTTGMPTPDGKPQIIPFQLVDNASGHVLAQAVLAALLNRERHGVADTVRVAMYDVAVGLQANQLTMHLNKTSGDRPRTDSAPQGKRRKGVGFATQPSDAFRAADGYLLISAYVPKHWHKLCHLIGRPDLLDDERFIDQRARAIHYHELTDELQSALAAKTAAEWVELLHEGGLMACLPYTWKQVVDTPLFAENQLAVEVGHGDYAVTVIRTPARYSSFSAVVADPPPAIGEHNDMLLTEP